MVVALKLIQYPEERSAGSNLVLRHLFVPALFIHATFVLCPLFYLGIRIQHLDGVADPVAYRILQAPWIPFKALGTRMTEA